MHNEAYSRSEAVPREEVDEGHNLWSRVQRVSDKYLFWLKKKKNEKKKIRICLECHNNYCNLY